MQEPPIQPARLAGTDNGPRSKDIPRRIAAPRPAARMQHDPGSSAGWFNHRRLLEPRIGYVPPAEYEAHHYQQAEVA